MSLSKSAMPKLVPLTSQPTSSSSTLPSSSGDAILTAPPSQLSSNSPASTDAIFSPQYECPPQRPIKGYEAMWHPKAGLIVSPNVSYIPRNVPLDLNADGSEQKNYSQPKLLNDDEIYRIFRPRFAQNHGALFGRLNFSREALAQGIVPVRNGKFILAEEIVVRWTRLEDALLDVGQNLLSAKRGAPSLTYPRFPWEFGYRDTHASREVTLRCALRSRDAFVELSSVVSFALSLHMDTLGGLDSAYKLVMERSTYKPGRAWFDLLSATYVCNFSANFRVGGYINPYTSHWMGYIPKFVQANVPIWVFWGHHHKKVYPLDSAAYKYSPPDMHIDAAMARADVTSALVLPIYRYDPYAENQGLPLSFAGQSDGDDPMGSAVPQWDSEPALLMVDAPSALDTATEKSADPSLLASRKQQALAALEEHFAKVQRSREARLAVETAREKQAREAREAHASTHKYSKTSAVYEWQEQDDGTYQRVKVDSREVDDVWGNYTRNQRRYTGHSNQWDLCPQYPRYSDENPKEAEPWNCDDSDYTSDDNDEEPFIPPIRKDPSSLQVPTHYPRPSGAAVFADDLREPAPDTNAIPGELSDNERLNKSHVETFDVAAYLRNRFGYDIFSSAGWRHKIQPSEKVADLKPWKAMMALSFRTAPPGPEVKDAVQRLVEILSNSTWRFSDLPTSFDHSNEEGVVLSSDTLDIGLAPANDSLLYVIHKRGYVDRCPWAIATYDASTVLLIFRNKWPTVDIIARELVARGVPFHTVFAAERSPVSIPSQPVRGLGSRPVGYKPTVEDYTEYLRRREDLLKGPKGRAALMYGGIVARIARDVLENDIILDGPSSTACTVGKYQRFHLFDDVLTDNDIDIICGVYHVKLEQAPKDESFADGTRSHMSWWPRGTTWTTGGAFVRFEWTELAEDFYQTRLKKLRSTPENALLNASAWRHALRKANAVTKLIEAGAEHYQSGYLEEHYRATRFVPQRR